MTVTHLTQKGQVLVPKHLRRKLGLQPGGKVHLDEEEGRLVLTPVPPDPIEAATGFQRLDATVLTNDPEFESVESSKFAG